MLNKESTAAWVQLGDKYFYTRSLWERRYGRWLHYQKENGMIADFEHEPKTFWFEEIKRGVRSYIPDYKIIDYNQSKGHFWVEVKGYYDSKSITKIKRFRKYYPEEKLILIDAKWFSLNSKKLKLIIPNWEV